MLKNLKIALAQFEYETGNTQKALEKAEKAIEKAAAQGVEMIVFPEIYYQGYCNSIARFQEIAETKDGALSIWLSEKSKQYNIYIIMGYCQKKDECPGELFNTTTMFNNNGEFVGDYVKVYGWGDENLVFTAGNKLPVYETPFGKIGFLTCYDIEFAEAHRVLAFKGADLLIVISAWSEHLRPRWSAGLIAGATQNLFTVAACNSVGLNPSNLPLAGDSMVVSPFGNIVAEANYVGKEELLIFDIDAKDMQNQRDNYPIWRDFRYDMFDKTLLERY